jgi:pseudouridine-5'-phosphate glycosidase/pseudouridine kinase
MYTTAVDLDLLSHSYWWKIVQGLSLGQQFRNELEQLAREPILQHDTAKGGLNLSFLTRDGVANMAINLLPFFQHVVIKCGEMGVVVVMRVAGMDSSWRGESTNMQQRRIVANGHEGTLVLSHHPPLESPAIVNVTGAGDSFVGALVATMVRDESVDIFRNPLSLNRSIHTAQRAAVLALASRNAVSPALSSVVIS